MGLALDDWNCLDEAEKAFKIAISLKPRSHIFKWNLSLLYNQQFKYHLSVKLFVEASELDPNEAEYYYEAVNVTLH